MSLERSSVETGVIEDREIGWNVKWLKVKLGQL